MGFFSWKTSDTKEPIRNRWTEEGATPCMMLDDTDRQYPEKDYDGYGVFCGVDFYELADKMNGGDGDRNRGIELAFSGDPGVKLPKIVSWSCDAKWADLPDSEIDPNQGYWQ